MKMSCHGCRVIRKGCNDECEIEWIESSDSQANATLFLVKFLASSISSMLSPQISAPLFSSRYYTRLVDGSVGLMWSGSWDHCQAAVDAVLGGSPITGIDADALQQKTNPNLDPPHKSGDIRHVSTDTNWGGSSHNKARTRNKLKRSMNRPKIQPDFATGSNINNLAPICNVPDPDDLYPSLQGNGSSGNQQAADDRDGGVGLELELTLGLGLPLPTNVN